MICEATLKDIDKIMAITRACALHMIDRNIYQWNTFYPNEQAFLKDLNRKELHVFKLNNEVIGCITISTFMDEEYIPVAWLTPNVNNTYIHRLAVHPQYQGKGYAQKLMDFAENYAKQNHFTSIRLDTFSQNSRNLKFYESRGYKRLGEIFFPKQSAYPFYCYEFVF